MKKLITIFALTLLNGQGFSQVFYKEYVTEKALTIVTPGIEYSDVIYDFDENGNPIYKKEEVHSFNYGVIPVLLDSVTFYSVRDSFLRDENFVFGELIIEDFDDIYCYECDSTVNPSYRYEFTRHRYFFGEVSDESAVKNEKFVYYFVGKTTNGVYYLHALEGIKREF